VNQREISIDAKSYSEALKSAMREAPDVIMIGEIRDTDTMKQAVVYSETGHLCLATIHASNAVETLDRVINFFPPDDREQILIDLSRNLHAVICQRLVKSKNGSLIPALEILQNSPYFSELIQKGKMDELTEAFERDMDQNIVTFDQSLIELYKTGCITADEAIKNADSKHNIQVQIRLKEDHKSISQDWEIKS
jgi:twitching motility protein PilU